MNDHSFYSSTSAPTDLKIANNATWMDAFQFGTPGDTTWSFDNQGFELDVQLNRYDTVPKLSLSVTNGRIVVDDPVQRVLHFDVKPDDLQVALSPGVYVYDLVMVDSATDDRTLLMHGKLYVGQGVTYPDGG
jgi:hypothetical protein